MSKKVDKALVVQKTGISQRVGSRISITDKLLKSASTEPLLIPYRKGDKWGFCNKHKEIIMPCQYDDARQFINGLAAVKIAEKWNYVTNDGKKLLQDDVYEVGDFFYKSSWVKTTPYQSSLINSQGEIVTTQLYDSIRDFREGLAACIVDEKCGFLDLNGKEIIKVSYNYTAGFKNGLAPVATDSGLGRKWLRWGFVNAYGEEIIEPMYTTAGYFSNGLAPVGWPLSHKFNMYIGIGENKFPLKGMYTTATEFSEDRAFVIKHGKGYYIDKQGHEIITPHLPKGYNFGFHYFDHDFSGVFLNGLALVRCQNDSDSIVHFIDKMGTQKSDSYFDLLPFADGLAAFQKDKNGLYGFIDNKFNEVIPASYDTYGNFVNGLAKVYKNGVNYLGKAGFIDKKGNEYWED